LALRRTVLLPYLCVVAPDEFRFICDREALEACFVDVGDGGLLRAGNGLLPEQIRAFVGGEFEIAGEDSQGESVEADTDASPV
jgi:hypothetical protein